MLGNHQEKKTHEDRATMPALGELFSHSFHAFMQKVTVFTRVINPFSRKVDVNLGEGFIAQEKGSHGSCNSENFA